MRAKPRRRSRTLPLLLVALGICSAAHADPPSGEWRAEGEIGVGGRTSWGDDEEGKLREYRDFDEGVIGDYRLRLRDPSGRYFFRSQGENLGYDDQRYWFESGRFGRFTLDGFYRELPHVFSTRARTLYGRSGGDTYRLPGGVQNRIVNVVAPNTPSTQLAAELGAARPADLELRWREAGGGVELQWSDAIRLYGRYQLQDKRGTRARAIGWGTPGGNFALFPLKVDEKIHEVRGGGEWLVGDGSLSLEYLGSFFENELRKAIVDNPLVEFDAAAAASRGRQSLAPDNMAHSLSLSGASPLPLPFPARVAGSLVYGMRLQDQGFLPHTVNSAILAQNRPGLLLPQGDLDGRVDTWLANLRVHLDPHPELDVDLRYRYYRYDNKSDEILFPEHVINDDAIVMSPLRSVANDYSVQKAGLDAAYDLTRSLTGHVGYEWEHWRRSDDRQVEETHEHGPNLKLDLRPAPGASVHASYAFRTRDGDGYDPYAHFDASLDAQGQGDARRFGESARLRKYDQADRDSHRVGALARSLIGERVEVSVSGGFQADDYRNSDFGLTDVTTWNAGGEVHVQAHTRVGVRVYYDFEYLLYEQDSRWRPRSFFVAPPGQIVAVDSALNEWSSRTRSRFHTTGLSLDVVLLPELVDLAMGYEFHYGRERTTSSGVGGFALAAPPTTAGDGGNTDSYPEIEEWLHALTAGLTLHFSEQVSVVGQYRYEIFDLDDDFRRQGLGPFLVGSNLNGSGGVTPSTDIFLGNDVRDYRAHLLRLITRIRF